MYVYILWDICGGQRKAYGSQFSPSTIVLTARTFAHLAIFPVTLHVFKNLYMYVFKFQVQGSQWSVSTVRTTHQVSTKNRQLGKLSLALIIGKVLFLFLFVLILGVMHARTFFNRILSINNAFWGLQDDFIYVNKTEVVVVWFDHVTVYVISWHLLYLHPIKKDWQLCGFPPSCLWVFGSFLSPL